MTAQDYLYALLRLMDPKAALTNVMANSPDHGAAFYSACIDKEAWDERP